MHKLQQLAQVTQVLPTEAQASRGERAAERVARERRETQCAHECGTLAKLLSQAPWKRPTIRSPPGPPAARPDEEPKVVAAGSKKLAAKKDKAVKEEKASAAAAAAAYQDDEEQGEEDSYTYDEQGEE